MPSHEQEVTLYHQESDLGLHSTMVKIADADQRWTGYYQSEAARVAGVLTQFKPLIEHIGSTAVPNLCAKPIIDFMIGVSSERDFPDIIKSLQSIGYVYHGEKGIPGRYFLTLGEPRTHHAHLVQEPGEFWNEHILFRDFLIEHPHIADDYAATKQALAKKYPNDRDSYTHGKTDFIMSVLDLAHQWKPPIHP